MEYQSGSIFIRRALPEVPIGTVMQGHTHNFDHTSLLLSGSVRARVLTPTGDVLTEGVYRAPWSLLIKAEHHHEFEALEDGTTLWCVYSHRDPQGEVCVEFNGWTDAYR